MTKSFVKVGLALGLLMGSASFAMADSCEAQLAENSAKWREAVDQLMEENDKLKYENEQLKKKLGQKKVTQKKTASKKQTQSKKSDCTHGDSWFGGCR
ncbi:MULTISPECIES: hypothetical protein [unclassified Campylobacter]|nr:MULTISPECIES: hypothetical protein [unclassified Campylobacter]MDA3083720.1 hypothetical protein [Campylobacter sp. CN_NE1]WBR52603.1 hypothetical protein PF028_06710 [Campylobacter sp. CN_NE2]